MDDTPNATTHLPSVQIIGRAGSATAYKIRDYLQRSDVPYEWIELVNDQQARCTGRGKWSAGSAPSGLYLL